MKNIYLLPFAYRCPVCDKFIDAHNRSGSKVGCDCITVNYDGVYLGGAPLQEFQLVERKNNKLYSTTWGRLVKAHEN